MCNSLWSDDHLQFTRLIAEIKAIGLTPKQLKELAKSMDLPVSRIKEIIDKADAKYEEYKYGYQRRC